ncbi:glycosyltransferase [Mesonia ostreae]|uniref:Glycosyltransferase n=1 Tax=Mesonia ostreae TaxID=861110 RepID=A0ABU2KEA4_9FLAO|nr:glycosyltransferase [Mesonia ostreae]MDT0293029.1 glycosyltransferase [Mesonia ostreae]
MVAYYAHTHGKGHLNSAYLFCENIYENSLIITGIKEIDESHFPIAQINDEDTTVDKYKSALKNLPKYAHYLPKSNPKIVERTKQILDIIIACDIKLALIDVSVETAIIFRIASVPYGYHLLLGNRNDNPHKIAFDAADFLYSFIPVELADSLPKKVINKTYFLGFHSQFKFTPKYCFLYERPVLKNKEIVVVCGNGGTKVNANVVNKIIDELPKCEVKILGNIENEQQIPTYNYIGFVDDIEHFLKKADVVISSCGLNLTSEILALKNKFVAVPEERPYNEQEIMCKALEKNNLAIRFNTDDIQGCIKKCLKLKPPKELKNWFVNDELLSAFKNKIEEYEK